MTMSSLAAHVLALLVLPILFVGIVNRTKAIWAGRRGPPLLQAAFDLRRLLRKRPVYSDVTTELFALGPLVLLATTLVSSFLVPVFAQQAPMAFAFDFVALAYTWGLGRFAIMLSALDTGSSFEGMGASREATFSAILEPTFFLAFGSLALATGARSTETVLHLASASPAGFVLTGSVSLALLVVLVAESSRVPVDDPATHLELTMIHEVMVLDHSGPELAAIQFATAVKMTLCAAMIATLVNPFRSVALLSGAFNVVVILAIAVLVGCVESLTARIKLRVVAKFLVAGIVAGVVGLLSAAWSLGGTP